MRDDIAIIRNAHTCGDQTDRGMLDQIVVGEHQRIGTLPLVRVHHEMGDVARALGCPGRADLQPLWFGAQ